MIGAAVGVVLVLIGGLATIRTPLMVRLLVRLWPRRLGPADFERFAATEFLVRYVGLLVALAGVALVIAEFV